MKVNTKHILITSLMLVIFVVSAISDEKILDMAENNAHSSTITISYFNLDTIHFDYKKGDSSVLWKLKGTYGNNGFEKTVLFSSFYSMNDAVEYISFRRLNDSLPRSTENVKVEPFLLNYETYTSVHDKYEFDFYSYDYLSNLSSNPFFLGFDPFVYIYAYSASDSGTFEGYADSYYDYYMDIVLTYRLEMNLQINSTYYNLDNVNVFVDSFAINEHTSTSFVYSNESTQQDPYNLVLSNPNYKLRIYDKATNNLIYSDISNQKFMANRVVNISALQIQNNAAEPINVELKENVGHYNGISFTNDQINTKTNEITVGTSGVTKCTGIVIDSYQGHKKVLKVNMSQSSLTNWEVISIVPFNFINPQTRFSAEWWFSTEDGNHWREGFYTDTIQMFYYSSGTQNGLYNANTGLYGSLFSISLNTWNHYRAEFYTNGTLELYLNNILKSSIGTGLTTISMFYFRSDYSASNSPIAKSGYYDSFDCSLFSGYYTNRNLDLNNSVDLWNYNTSIIENNGHFQGSESFDFSINNNAQYTVLTGQTNIIQNSHFYHYKVLNVSMTQSWSVLDTISFNPTHNIAIEFWIDAISGDTLYFTFSGGSSSFQYRLMYSGGNLYLVRHNPGTIIKTYSINSGWIHIYMSYNASGGFCVKADNEIVDYYTSEIGTVSGLSFTNQNGFAFILDAVDYSTSPNYFVNRNQLLNYSTDLLNWNAFPQWNNGYYQEGDGITLISYSSTNAGVERIASLNGHNDVLHQFKTLPSSEDDGIVYNFPDFTTGNIEFWIYGASATANSHLYIADGIGSYYFSGNHFLDISAGWASMAVVNTNQWYHIRITYNATGLSFFVDNNYRYGIARTGTCTLFQSMFYSSEGGTQHCDISTYFDGFYASSDSSYFSNKNKLENTTASPLPPNYNLTAADNRTTFSSQINPYSSTIMNFTQSNYLYKIRDIYENSLINSSISAIQNSIIFTPFNTRQCFISLANQRNDYLAWENYRIKINNSLIYSNSFYREINSIVNISIYTRFDKYLTSIIYQVNREENYIPITLNQFSLKIANYQENFIYSNVSFDSNYYVSSQYWSEWLAPKSEIEILLSPGYYKINISESETNTITIYSYTLNSDDILLIQSNYALFNVIENVKNVNVTMENQITEVELNLSNQNSQINNTIVNFYISLNNTNSTLNSVLFNLDFAIQNLQSNFNEFAVISNNSLYFLNSTSQNMTLIQQNNHEIVMSELNQLRISQQNNYSLLNNLIEDLSMISLDSFAYLNNTIDRSITYMMQNFTYLQNYLGSNQIDVMTQFVITQNNINSSSQSIIANAVSINNTISLLIEELQQNVLLVNDTIYTANLNISSQVAVLYNDVLGNLSLTYSQNEFLTHLYQTTMFSKLLNWTLIGRNYSLIEEQIAEYFIWNNYVDEDVKTLMLRYQGQIQNLTIKAAGITSENLPAADVEYRVWSETQQKYLTNWTAIPENRTVSLGTFVAPLELQDLQAETNDWLMLVAFLFSISVACIYIFVDAKKKQKQAQRKKGLQTMPKTFFQID